MHESAYTDYMSYDWKFPDKDTGEIDYIKHIDPQHIHNDHSMVHAKVRSNPVSVIGNHLVKYPPQYVFDKEVQFAGFAGILSNRFLWGADDYKVLIDVNWFLSPPPSLSGFFGPASLSLLVWVEHNQEPNHKGSLPTLTFDVSTVMAGAVASAASLYMPEGQRYIKAYLVLLGTLLPKVGDLKVTMSAEWNYEKGESKTIQLRTGGDVVIAGSRETLMGVPDQAGFYSASDSDDESSSSILSDADWYHVVSGSDC